MARAFGAAMVKLAVIGLQDQEDGHKLLKVDKNSHIPDSKGALATRGGFCRE